MKETDRYWTSVENYKKSFDALQKSALDPIKTPRDLSGIIKDFELTYELGWKCLKKFLEKEGHATHSAKDAISKAYQLNYLKGEQIWLAILQDRNLTVHIYNQSFAEEICQRIKKNYLSAFAELLKVLSGIDGGTRTTMPFGH